MAKVALIETKPSRHNFKRDFQFDFDRYALCSDPNVKTVRKKDMDIEFDESEYDWVILVGADPFKVYAKKGSISDYSGKLVNDKFLPTINPAMVKFKPEAEPLWLKSKKAIEGYISGELNPTKGDTSRFPGIEDEDEALVYINEAIEHPNKYCAVDCETTGLYPRNGYLQGVSISFKKDWGAYISADCFTEKVVAAFQKLIDTKIIVFHNAKFDIPFIEFHLGVKFKDFEDTMLLHYCLDENPGTHGLKQLALRMTEYGDYEEPLQEWMNDFRSKHGINKADFDWSFIPFDVMVPYAACDSVVTLLIFTQLRPLVARNSNLNSVYTNILLPACRMLVTMQDNGVPFDMERLKFGQAVMRLSIEDSIKTLYTFDEITQFEKEQEAPFNPNSPIQLRKLLFDHIGLQSTGKMTATGKISTDAEVLKALADQHEIPKAILNIRKKSKLKNTYLDKCIVNLDKDFRLRTNFNLHGTVAGRLSSSGKMNMQQLPRDGSVVKGSIKARPGYKIVSMDLATAEVYVVAVLSGDKTLQAIFKNGEDFHSSIAKISFRLDCPVEKVKELYPDLRQAAKAITFGILYQAGPPKIAETINKDAKEYGLDLYFSVGDAQEAINNYFGQFPKLKKWIDDNKKDIANKGFTYSFFGRKRRLPNVKSDNRGVQSHAIRSGLNFLVQSPASDINLLAAVDIQNRLDQNDMDAKLFALVHDSILAEVLEADVDRYCAMVKECVQKDRGMSIVGAPVGCDFEVGDDYSFGKFDKDYSEIFQLWTDTSVEHREELELADYL